MFTVAPIQESDLEDMFNEVRRSQYQLKELGWLSECDQDKFYNHYRAVVIQQHLQIFVVRVFDQFAGCVEVADRSDYYEIGYWLGASFRGQGLSAIAIQAVINQLELRPVQATAPVDNVASWKVLENVGFQLVKSDSTTQIYRLTRKAD
jgi:RimJ/RimL family protein N-acetyltransferase